MLTIHNVTKYETSYKLIKNLYQEAFPEEERIPFPLLLLRAKATWIEFLAFYEQEQFCGFLYLMHGYTHISIMYLAIPEELRSLGYGRKILKYLRKKYKNKTLVLEVETPNKKATNYEQQLRRKDFYHRNGFLETGYSITMYQVDYEVLKSQSYFRPREWEELIRRLSFHFMNFTLKKSIDI